MSLTNFFIQKPSPLALSTVNQTIFQTKNILVQDLENPFGIRFRIVLLKVATCSRAGNVRSARFHIQTASVYLLVFLILQWANDTSWFPGYSWKVCMCPVCSVHIGWMYEPNETAVKSLAFPSDRGFYALLLNHVLSESCMFVGAIFFPNGTRYKR